MEEPFVDLMKSLGPIGILILILIVAVPLIIAVIKGVHMLYTNTGSWFERKTVKKLEDKQFRKDLNDLVGVVSGIQESLNSITEQNTELQNEFESGIKKLNDKIDANHLESKSEDMAIHEDIIQHSKDLNNIKSQVDRSDKKVNILIDSNKEANKAFITNLYYESIKEKFIPVYKLESVETIYEQYLLQNGDTFVADLMTELRELPHTKP